MNRTAVIPFLKQILHNKWSILAFNIGFFILITTIFPFLFEENDDVTMCLIANGGYTGMPNGHLVFINAIYGWIVAGLYSLSHCVEWYTLSFCVLQIISMSVISHWIISKSKWHWAFRTIICIVLYILWIRMIVALQFTTTAGLLCLSGCIALLQDNKKWQLYSITAIFVASLIRFKAAGLIGLLFMPIFLNEILLLKRKFIIRTLFLIVIFCLTGWGINRCFYLSSDWNHYYTYNALRGGINDNPNLDYIRNDLPNSISEEDFSMLCSFMPDAEFITISVLQNIKASIQSKTGIQHYVNNLKQLSLYRIPLALLGLLFVVLSCANRGGAAPIANIRSTNVLHNHNMAWMYCNIKK